MSVAFKSAIDDAVLDELRAIIGDDDRVLPNLSSRVNRTRVPAPFPVHRWGEFMPDSQYLISEWGIATSAGVGAFFAIAPRLWE